MKAALDSGSISLSDDLHSLGAEVIAPLPRVAIQAFCETPDAMHALETAKSDRRLDKAHLRVSAGGIKSAIETFQSSSTPNVIVLEVRGEPAEILADLDGLAEYCDPTTKVVVIGRHNDIGLFRELTKRGVSEYLISPVGSLDVIRALSGLFHGEGAEAVGRVVAVLGTKGGVGSSTVAHNLAWSIANTLDIETVIADLDLGFGTAALDFDQDPPQGIAEAVFSPDRLDANLIDRLLARCSDKLSLLAAPALLDRVYDFQEQTFDGIFDILRQQSPCTVVDLPHVWTSWAKRVAISADELVIVSEPDLASFRNVKNMIGIFKAARPHDNPPRLVINKHQVPKRPELPINDFAKVLDTQPSAIIPYDAELFGAALNNGRMLSEIRAKARQVDIFNELAHVVMGRQPVKKPAGRSALEPLLARLKLKK
jgi:pilus assembly protein CpaE